MTEPGPALVTLHVWTVPARALPSVLVRMAADRRAVRQSPGVRFAKLLGTGSGRTFSARDADLRHWALLTCWSSRRDAAAFEASPLLGRWSRLADATWRVELAPLSCRGSWSGRAPFGGPARSAPGEILSVTRARLRPSRAMSFWRAVPAVAGVVPTVDGLVGAFGVGEAPLGVQGTVSVWRDAAAVRAFAFATAEHRAVAAATEQQRWYAEEMFARFSVLGESGVRPFPVRSAVA